MFACFGVRDKTNVPTLQMEYTEVLWNPVKLWNIYTWFLVTYAHQ